MKIKINAEQCELYFKYKEILAHHQVGLSQKEIHEKLGINYNTVRGYFSLLRKHGVLNEENELAFTDEEFNTALENIKQLEEERLEKALLLLKASGKTLEYIQDCLGLESEEATSKFIDQVRVKFAADYTIYANRKANEEVIYLAVKKEQDNWRNFVPRQFDIDRASDGTPYLWIQLHKELDSLEKIKIIPIADLHYGSTSFNKELFEEYLEYIKNTPNVFIILLGDMIENATKQSIADGVYLQFEDPQDQCLAICKMLSPIQHKILLSVRGNHEKRSRQLGLDPGVFIAEMLDIPYFAEPTYMDIMFNSHRFMFRVWHGRGASRTEGGKLNSAIEPTTFTNFTHFYLSAHVHDAMVKKKNRVIRDVENSTLIERKQYVIIAPSFLNYFGTYASEAGYPPPARGTCTCNLFNNGDYHATS